MRRRAEWILFLAALCLATAAAAAPSTIEVAARFYGSADFSRYRSYAWREGTPAPNNEAEGLIREGVQSQLERKGYHRNQQRADLHVATHAVRNAYFSVGVLRVNVFDGGSGRLVWEGVATGLASEKKKTNIKTIKKAIKKLFKSFPNVK
jgi:hypothetical protein